MLALGSEVENNIVTSVAVLQARDATAARRLVAADRDVNQKRIDIMNLERAADRVINICEWVVYMANGHFYEMDSEFEAPPAQVGA